MKIICLKLEVKMLKFQFLDSNHVLDIYLQFCLLFDYHSRNKKLQALNKTKKIKIDKNTWNDNRRCLIYRSHLSFSFWIRMSSFWSQMFSRDIFYYNLSDWTIPRVFLYSIKPISPKILHISKIFPKLPIRFSGTRAFLASIEVWCPSWWAWHRKKPSNWP